MVTIWKCLSCPVGFAPILAVLAATLPGVLVNFQEHQPPVASNSPASLPPGKLGEVIRLGQQLIEETDTHPLSRDWVGNSMQCTSCHLDAGRHKTAATFRGVATAYPAYAPREDRVITLEDRILNCFMRSMNGTRPPNGGPVSTAMASYITWLSQGESMQMNPRQSLGPGHLVKLKVAANEADLARGQAVYEDRCGFCHGDNGEGGDDGPPVWGGDTYNQGAGFYKNEKLASWIKVAMPLGDATLSEQESMDVAAYLNSKPHPDFRLEEHLAKPSSSTNSNGKE